MASDAADKRMERIRKELSAAEKVYKEWADEFKVDKLEGFVVRSRQTKDKHGKQLQADSYQVNLLAPSLASRIPALMFDNPHAIVTAKDPMADDAAQAALQPPAPPMGLPPQGMPGMPPGPDVGGLAALLGGGMPGAAPPLPMPKPKPLTAQDKAKLREDLVNTIIQDQESRFSSETKLAIRESFFRFGLVEAIYTFEPEEVGSGKTVSFDSKEPGPPPGETEEVEGDGTGDNGPKDQLEDAAEGEAEKPLEVPSVLPKPGSERIKFRRIPAAQVRVSANQKNDLDRCDWIAYFEWMYLSDIQKNKNFRNRFKVKATHSNASGDEGGRVQKEDEVVAPADGMVKVWKQWNIRDKKRYIWPDGEDFFLVDGKEFEFLPLAVLKFEELLDQFYPVPPAFYWTGTQIEYNETRDAQRTHRRRALRKFVYNDGAFPDDEELAKLTSNEDMAFARIVGNVPATAAISPVQAAPMDPISVQQVAMVRDELQQVTKVGGEQRGVASSDTATQANIISMNKQIQDTTDRNTVAEFLNRLCWIALKLAESNFTTQTVIKTSVDTSGAGAQQEGQRIAETWKAIEMDQLGDLDYQVEIDVESLAPPSSTLKAQQANQMMATLSNPNVLAIMAQPDAEPFVRQFLAVQGYKDETMVQALIGSARAIVGQMQAQAAAQAAPPPGAAPGAPTPEGSGIPGDGGVQALQQGIGALA